MSEQSETLQRNEEGKILPPSWYKDYEGGITIRRKHSTSVIRNKAEGSKFPFPLLKKPDEVREYQNPDMEEDTIKFSKHRQNWEQTYEVEEE